MTNINCDCACHIQPVIDGVSVPTGIHWRMGIGMCYGCQRSHFPANNDDVAHFSSLGQPEMSEEEPSHLGTYPDECKQTERIVRHEKVTAAMLNEHIRDSLL